MLDPVFFEVSTGFLRSVQISRNCGGDAEYDLVASWEGRIGACANSSFWRAKITAPKRERKLLVLAVLGVKRDLTTSGRKCQQTPKKEV